MRALAPLMIPLFLMLASGCADETNTQEDDHSDITSPSIADAYLEDVQRVENDQDSDSSSLKK